MQFEDKASKRLATQLKQEVTRRRLLEEALWDSQKRYEALLGALPVGLFQSDSSGKCVYTNEQTQKILGLSPEEITDFKWLQALHPDDRDKVITELNKCSVSHKALKIEHRYVHPGGNTVWALGQAVPYFGHDNKYLGHVGTLFDITEIKKTEEALRKSERFLANIFESIHDRLSIIDTEFNIIRVNKKVEQSYPKSLPLVGKKCYRVYYGYDNICEGCPSVITLKTGCPAHGIFPIKEPGGNTTGWLDHHCFPLVDTETGNMDGVIIYARDITEKIRVEQEMARLERLNLVGEMAASIGHEVRKPVPPIQI